MYDAFTDGGKQYGVPESFSNVVLFYNKALFKKAGVAEPTAEWTWKDEQAAAAKLTDKGAKVWGDYQPVSYNEFYKVLAQNGGEFLNADRTEATFNSPQGVEAAKFLIDKVGKTMPTEADGAGTPDFDSKLFKTGKLAMWHTGIWMFSAMADAPFDWDVVVEPGNTTKASAMFVNGLVVSAASKNAEAAQKWVTFLASSDETTKTRLATSWELPPVADEAKLAPYLDQKKPANRQAVFTALENTVLPPVIERQQEMQDAGDRGADVSRRRPQARREGTRRCPDQGQRPARRSEGPDDLHGDRPRAARTRPVAFASPRHSHAVITQHQDDGRCLSGRADVLGVPGVRVAAGRIVHRGRHLPVRRRRLGRTGSTTGWTACCVVAGAQVDDLRAARARGESPSNERDAADPVHLHGRERV